MPNAIAFEAKVTQAKEHLERLEAQQSSQSDPRIASSLQQAISRAQRAYTKAQAQLATAEEANKARTMIKLPALRSKAQFLRQKAALYTTQADQVELQISSLEQA